MKIFAIVIAVAALGGGVWYMSSSKAVEKQSAMTEATTLASADATSAQTSSQASTPGEKVTGSPEELAKKGGQYKCTFSIKDPNTESSGTIYIDGKKFRGDFTSYIKVVNQSAESHSISDGDFSYSWTSVSPIGYKVPLIDNGNGAGSGAMSGSLSMNGANSSWNCVVEKFGSEKFALPADIKFMQSPATPK
jgi:hypothetical protein